jgi:hypothetical protein
MSTGPNLPAGYTIGPLVSLADIVSSANLSTISSQVADTARLHTLFTMNPEVLKTQIVEWINSGATGEKILWSQPFPQPRYLTMDGQYIARMRYILACLNMTKQSFQESLTVMFPGLNVGFEVRDDVFIVFIRL